MKIDELVKKLEEAGAVDKTEIVRYNQSKKRKNVEVNDENSLGKPHSLLLTHLLTSYSLTSYSLTSYSLTHSLTHLLLTHSRTYA